MVTTGTLLAFFICNGVEDIPHLLISRRAVTVLVEEVTPRHVQFG